MEREKVKEKEKNRHHMKRNRPDTISDVEASSRVHSTGYHRQRIR